jgi:predicted CXXCH cytochrome family protein
MRYAIRIGLRICCMLAVFGALTASMRTVVVTAGESPGGQLAMARSDPDAVCASCHKDISERYRKTPMALGSGLATDGILQGGFKHQLSGVEYKVFLRDGSVWMSYRRDAADAAASKTTALDGERKLKYFVGSGHRGRTYLYEESGLWFEAPINYYGKKGLWDMAPNYGASKTMPGILPVDSNCLHCHATGVQEASSAARNRYAEVPFTQGGIGCAACHGDAKEHLARQGRGKIVNPAKLAAAKRDSICLQCHLEGNAAIYKTGKSLAEFRPGDDIAEHVTYFVKSGGDEGAVRATSQYEALLRSRCKIASGDKLTCTTCHDPHGSPSDSERVSYYRGKCLSCHTSPAMATTHHPEQPDCAACHMPARTTTDISHEQATDHFIRKRPEDPILRFTALSESMILVPVGNVAAGDRELGLAYAQFAQRGDHVAAEKALRLLRKAEAAGDDDAELHSQLGLLAQMSGDKQAAQKEYADALLKDPDDLASLGNLAVLDASSGHAADAVKLLKKVVNNDPGQIAAGMNLAFIQCKIGNPQKAIATLNSLRRFSPDDPALNTFLETGVYAGLRCDLHGMRENAGGR